uniref:Late embryogenesis abundant protein LEA-2 subgroup domain-containing protein n=1 Tax=Physcomitrium patens TaxID=3218 RepID=A9S8F2_PHYPA|nr:hypothetical protein PHYPA_015862 [Physcomitrium patens]
MDASRDEENQNSSKVCTHPKELKRQETIPLKKHDNTEVDEEAAPASTSEKTSTIAVIAVISLILFLGLFALITWLAIRPIHAPRYTIDGVRVKSFNMNATDSTLSTLLEYSHRSQPQPQNELQVRLDHARYSIQWTGLGQGLSDGAFQATQKQQRHMVFHSQRVEIRTSTGSLTAQMKNASVPLQVYSKAKIHVVIGMYKSFPLNVVVDCKLVVAPPSPTNLEGKVVSKLCRLTRPRYKRRKS